jgi:hypothetical protein
MNSTWQGGNLDISAELYNSTGSLILSNNPGLNTYARIQTNLIEGRYFLLIRGIGAGSPLSSTPGGYTAYGSLGQHLRDRCPSSLISAPSAELIEDVNLPGVEAGSYRHIGRRRRRCQFHRQQ